MKLLFQWLGITLVSIFVFSEFSKAEDKLVVDEIKDTTYTESPLNAGLDITYVPIRYPEYLWGGGGVQSNTGNGLQLSLEWMPLISDYGKVGVGLGFGFNAIKNVNLSGTNATFTAIPLNFFVDYRLDLTKNQIVVPFFKLGGEAVWARQTGVDVPTKIYTGLLYGGGLQLCLNKIDSGAARDIDVNFGINNTYIIFEYLKSSALSKGRDPLLAREEYRLGLRFEM